MAHDVGGKYPAIQQDNGKWTIKGVPILTPVPQDERKNKKTIADDWMSEVVKRHQMRLAEGYKAPTHVRHHGDSAPTEPAGTFVPTGVSSLIYEGKKTPVLLADLEDIPEAIYERIAKGELAFRSIEVAWDLNEIQSLALLPDEAPFSKLPLLGVGEQITRKYPVQNFKEPSLVAALCATPKISAVLLRFNDAEKFAKDEEGKEKPAIDADPAAKEKTAPEPTGGSEMSILVQLAEKQVAMLQAILQRIGVTGADPANPDQAGLAGGAPHDQAKPEVKKPEQMSAEVQTMLGKLSGEVDALKSRQAKNDEEAKISKLANGAFEQLKEWHINEKTRETIKTMATLGEVALKAHVESFKLNTPKDPPGTFAAYEGGGADNEDVLAFGKHGPKALERARFWAGQYERTLKTVPLKKFIEVQLKSELAESVKS